MRSVLRVGVGLLLGSVTVACANEPVSASQYDLMGGTLDHSCLEQRAITLDETSGAAMPDKTLVLTFDDGPSESTLALSAYLATQKIAATFFVNGSNIEGREEIVAQQITDGHLLGNHTHTHQSLTALTPAEMVAEVEETDKLIVSYAAPGDKLFFRPPFGEWNSAVVSALSNSAMYKYEGPVGWDIGDKLTATTGADWECWDEENGNTRTVQQCGNLYLQEIRAKKKGIVLMHDGSPETANGVKTLAMVKYLVPLLKKDGYSFARLDQVTIRPPAPGAQGTGGESGQPKTTLGSTQQRPANQEKDPCNSR